MSTKKQSLTDYHGYSIIRSNASSIFNLLFLFIIIIALSSCSTSRTIKNSYVQDTAEDEHVAKVYFIRPKPIKFKGLADNRITVEINGEQLLRIDEGAYTMVKIKPAKASITTRSKTMFTNQTQPMDVSRTREYRFIAGKTYLIHLKRVNEEFRGIYYDPAPVTLEQAKLLAKRLRAAGGAKSEPIRKLTNVAEIPTPGSLEPALPESLYPGKKYLIKGNPKYTAPKQDGKNEITFDKPPESETPLPPKSSN